MRAKITTKLIEKLKPAAQPYDVSDTELKGYVLRVERTGRKLFYFRYRPRGGDQTRIKLGDAASMTEEEARNRAKKEQVRIIDGADPARERRRDKARTLGGFVENEYAPKYLGLHKIEGTDEYDPDIEPLRKSALETMHRLKACFKEDFWDMPLTEITAARVANWVQGRQAENKSNATINRDLNCLRGVLTQAVGWEFLKVHPLNQKRVKPLKEDKSKKPRYLTPDEETRLMKALDTRQEEQRKQRKNYIKWCSQHPGFEAPSSLEGRVYTDHLKPMVILSLHTGMRRNEVFSLEWRDVDFTERQIEVRGDITKNESTRYIPMNDAAHDVLATWKAEQPGTGLVFPSPATGGKLDNVQTSWEKIVKKASLDNFVWHNLRSTFASRLVQAGTDLYTVKELLGHQSITTTEQRYAALAPEQKHQAVARLMRPGNVVPFTPRQDGAEADPAVAQGKAE